MTYGIGSANNVLSHNQIKEIISQGISASLATAISPEICEKINLGYLDPGTVNPKNYRNREDESILYVTKAGEILHRLKK